jgi:putative SOS response-associated peptidase YedK
MCSRYELTADSSELTRRFTLHEPLTETVPATVGPVARALVIEAVPGQPGRRRVRVLTFGVPAPWDGRLLLNARIETLLERKTFRPLLQRRCLVPATAYFEWRRESRRRIKNRITRQDGSPVAFAGLIDGNYFLIVTAPAAPTIAHVHDRMPAVVAPDLESAWLDPTVPFAEVRRRLQSEAGAALTASEEKPRLPAPGLFDALA